MIRSQSQCAPFPGALLLLLMSNLLLWEEVASMPMYLMRNGRCLAPLEVMIDRAVNLSEKINKQAFEMFTEFVSTTPDFQLLTQWLLN